MSRSRLLAVRVAAGFLAFLFWLPSLAVGDLVTGLIPTESASSHATRNLARNTLELWVCARGRALLCAVVRWSPLEQSVFVFVFDVRVKLRSGELERARSTATTARLRALSERGQR